jgi:hypothetical protein
VVNIEGLFLPGPTDCRKFEVEEITVKRREEMMTVIMVMAEAEASILVVGDNIADQCTSTDRKTG